MFVGIDVGSTEIKLGYVESLEVGSKIIKKNKFPNSGSFDTDIQHIVDSIKEFSLLGNIKGIGIGVPGILDQEKQTVTLSANIKHWMNQPVVQILKKEFEVPVFLDNDSVVAAKGEAFFGDYNSNKFLFIIWGTGIGGAYVMKNSDGIVIIPSEPGHQMIVRDGKPCGCGQKGCLELYSGGGNLVKHYGKEIDQFTDQDWEKILDDMAFGIANALNILEVPTIVLGGTVSLRQSLRTQQLEEYVNRHFRGPQHIGIFTSSLKEDAGIFGAASLLKDDKVTML